MRADGGGGGTRVRQSSARADRRSSTVPVVVPALVAIALIALALASAWPSTSTYRPWDGELSSGRRFVQWLFSAWTEAEFYTSALAGAGLLIGGGLAAWAERTNKRWQGFGMACGSGLWPGMMASSALGLLLSNVAWGWTLRETGLWQPTFVPVVSVAPTLVLTYGPGWPIVLTGAVLSALGVAPLSIAATHFLCRPLGLPLVVGVTGGMAIGGLAVFALCTILPWLPPRRVPPPTCADRLETYTFCWALRRMLADVSEAQFFGNEWASAGLMLGVLAAFALAPRVPVYGSGLLPQLIAAQALAAAAGMAFWRRMWVKHGFYPTFVPIVSVAPAAVLAFGGTLYALWGALLGALVGPPLAAAISARLPKGFHPFIGNVASMALSTAIIIPALSLLHST